MAKKRESRRERRQRESRERERASIGATRTNLGHIGTSVDSDILTHALSMATSMGQSSQQAAIEAARIQQLRDSGKTVHFTDGGYHTS